MGIDLSREMSTYAHQHSSLSTEVITADMVSPPFKTGSFASAINTLSSISCLDGMTSIATHLREACGLLSSHGVYVIDFLIGVPAKRREKWQIERGQVRCEVRWEIVNINRRSEKFLERISVRTGSRVLQSTSQTTVIRGEEFCSAASKAGFDVESWFRPFRMKPLDNRPTRGRVIVVLRKKT